MKIRHGFVSNSSSSSYICDITGEDASGWDICLSEAGMYQCENGHTMLESYVEKRIEDVVAQGIQACLDVCAKISDDCRVAMAEAWDDMCESGGELTTNELRDLFDEVLSDWEGRYELPEALCPICQLDEVIDGDALRYLLKKMGRTLESIKDEIKTEYGDRPKEFYELLK